MLILGNSKEWRNKKMKKGLIFTVMAALALAIFATTFFEQCGELK
jgi:hypothetical protein